MARATLALCLACMQVCWPVGAWSQPLPTLGDSADMSTSAERRLGDRIAAQIFQDADYLDDPVLMDYVQGIWTKLMAAARSKGDLSDELNDTFAWTMVLDRDRAVNAFALPGGYMGVNLGLIAVVSSEDELASVLGHELSHITQRHISRLIGRQSSQGPLLLAAMILGAMAAGSNPQAASAMIVGGQAAAIQGQLNFSRDMEREADRVGYGVMTQAGYQPQGFVTMFEKLQQANRFNDTGGFPYLRSHPMTTERIADMQTRQQLLPELAPTRLTMLHALIAARARVLSTPKSENLLPLVERAFAPEYDKLSVEQRAGVLYGALLAGGKLKVMSQVWPLFASLQSMAATDARSARLVQWLGQEVALADSDVPKAQRLMGSDEPDPTSRAGFFLWAQITTKTAPQRVTQGMQTWIANHPKDAPAWQLLAGAYQAQGKQVQAVRAEAESFAVTMNYSAAQNRFRAAQDLVRQSKDVDNIEASIIDTRKRQMDSLLREQALER